MLYAEMWMEGKEDLLQDYVRYIVYQLEQGQNSLHYHLQGYVELKKNSRLSYLKKKFNEPTMHAETMISDRVSARNYCRKDETRVSGPWEFGVWNPNGQGNRTDLDEVQNMIMNGMLNKRKLMTEYPSLYCRYRQGLNDICAEACRMRGRLPRVGLWVEIYVGPPGCGKTRSALTVDSDWFKLDRSATGNAAWFDGYEDENTLVLDDYYGWLPWSTLLNILDIHPLRIDKKGTHGYALWNRVIITTNSHPCTWYDFESGKYEYSALKRRVHRVRVWGSKERTDWEDKLLSDTPTPTYDEWHARVKVEDTEEGDTKEDPVWISDHE